PPLFDWWEPGYLSPREDSFTGRFFVKPLGKAFVRVGSTTGTHKGQYLSNREMGVGIGRATTRAHPPHPLPARPYYTTNRLAQPEYSRGRGGCGRGDGALVAARPYSPPHLFSLFERYWPLWLPVRASPYLQYIAPCGAKASQY